MLKYVFLELLECFAHDFRFQTARERATGSVYCNFGASVRTMSRTILSTLRTGDLIASQSSKDHHQQHLHGNLPPGNGHVSMPTTYCSSLCQKLRATSGNRLATSHLSAGDANLRSDHATCAFGLIPISQQLPTSIASHDTIVHGVRRGADHPAKPHLTNVGEINAHAFGARWQFRNLQELQMSKMIHTLVNCRICSCLSVLQLPLCAT